MSSYREAGVDIVAAERLVDRIKPAAQATRQPGVLAGLGGFGALYELPEGYKKPVLVSGTDGVGTKLKLAIDCDNHAGIGIDLVAMCVNDILTVGATPLYFLDYLATSKLDVDQAANVIESIAKGCELSNSALIGGETAEMPGMYQAGDYDIAGFAVGVVEKEQIIDGSSVKAGDVLIGLASSGVHANGFSLVRHVLAQTGTKLSDSFAGSTFAEVLLAPTRIYVNSVLALLKEVPVKAMAHITGGGLTENLPRVMPKGLQAQVDYSSWQMPEIFAWLQQHGDISDADMRCTFNLGVGYVVCVAAEHVEQTLRILKQQDESAWVLGGVVRSG